MASQMTFPENFKTVFLYSGAANAVDCDFISCKNAHKVWFLIHHSGANDTDLTLSLTEATDVAAGTSAAVTATFPIWLDDDAGTTSDTLVKQTNAASYVIDPATENPVILFFEWDPSLHTAGYDCIAVGDSGGHGSNTVEIYAIIQPRYQQATPPSAIID